MTHSTILDATYGAAVPPPQRGKSHSGMVLRTGCCYDLLEVDPSGICKSCYRFISELMDAFLTAGVHQQPEQSDYLAEGQT